MLKKIDKIRNDFDKKIYVNINGPLKIIHVGSEDRRKIFYYSQKKKKHGLIKLGQNVITISDRDFSKNLYGSKILHDNILQFGKSHMEEQLWE